MDMSYDSCPRDSNYSSAKCSNSSNAFNNLWGKPSLKPKDENLNHRNNNKTPKKKASNQSDVSDKIIMSKKQLMEFTKKFALNKVDYEEEISYLKTDSEDKCKKIQVLQSQINELRTQQDYLIEVMEQLRDRHLSEMSSIKNKYECHAQMRQDEIDHLQQQILKVRQWLDEQKIQSKRCMEFIKIKDQIIQKLEQQVLKYQNQLKFSKQSQISANMNNYNSINIRSEEIATQRPRINSNRKIILRREKKQTNCKSQQKYEESHVHFQNNYKRQSKQIGKLNNIINNLRIEKIQIEEEKFQIFSKYRQVTIENDYLRKAIQKLQKQHVDESKMKKSIHNLDQITKRIKDTQQNKQNLLVTKCLFLEKHVEKLAKQLSDVKSSHVLSLSNLSSQLISSESHTQFDQ